MQSIKANQKTIVIVTIVIILALGAGFWMWKKQRNWITSQDQIKTEKIAKTNTDVTNTSNWKTYRNEEYGFEVQIPKNWEIDIQSHNEGILPIPETMAKNKILENKGYSIQFSFGPRESKAGGYITGIYIESRKDGSIDDIIKRDFVWENREKVFIRGQSADLLCWKSGCKQGETGIDKRIIFEREDLIWQIFGSISSDKGSKEKVREIEDFFITFQFLD